VCDQLIDILDSFSFSNAMRVDEFLTIPDEDIIYDISDDQIIEELVSTFNSDDSNEIENEDEIDDSIETPIISATTALENLKNIRLFLLQQEESNEQLKLVDNLEKFTRKKRNSLMLQTSIDMYFN
jgi:hypothetical protein